MLRNVAFDPWPSFKRMKIAGVIAFLGEEAGRFGVEILAWCLMTNHVHFIAVPKKGDLGHIDLK